LSDPNVRTLAAKVGTET